MYYLHISLLLFISVSLFIQFLKEILYYIEMKNKVTYGNLDFILSLLFIFLSSIVLALVVIILLLHLFTI